MDLSETGPGPAKGGQKVPVKKAQLKQKPKSKSSKASKAKKGAKVDKSTKGCRSKSTRKNTKDQKRASKKKSRSAKDGGKTKGHSGKPSTPRNLERELAAVATPQSALPETQVDSPAQDEEGFGLG